MRVDIGDYPEDGGVQPFDVVIHSHDLWNVNTTLSHIIYPVLVKFKEFNQGYGSIDDEDVPESMRNGDPYCHDKWNYALDEMIWSFGEYSKNEHWDNLDQEYHKRLQNGFRLFGKYYQTLWS